MIGVKYKQEEAEKIVKQNGFELLEQYINWKTKVSVKCSCGNILKLSLVDIVTRKTKNCGHCNDPKIGYNFGKLVVTELIHRKNGCIIKCLCKCGKMWIGPLSFLKSKKYVTCGKCNYPEINKKYNHLTIKSIEPHKNGRLIVTCICDCGNIYNGKFDPIRRGHRISCGKCRHKMLSIKFPEIAKEWDYEKNYPLTPDNIKYGSYYKRWWICQNGHSYQAIVNDRTGENKNGCPICRNSKGEKETERILNLLNIRFERQKRFLNCRYIKSLSFDFYLPEYNTLIEYQGEHHYIPILYKNEIESLESLKKLKKRDKIKRRFCKINNIKLISIKYTNFNNIEQILKFELGLGDKDESIFTTNE